MVHVHFLSLSIPTRLSSFFSYCSSMRLKAIPSAKKWASYRIAYLYRFLIYIYILHFSINYKLSILGCPHFRKPRYLLHTASTAATGHSKEPTFSWWSQHPARGDQHHRLSHATGAKNDAKLKRIQRIAENNSGTPMAFHCFPSSCGPTTTKTSRGRA